MNSNLCTLNVGENIQGKFSPPSTFEIVAPSLEFLFSLYWVLKDYDFRYL